MSEGNEIKTIEAIPDTSTLATSNAQGTIKNTSAIATPRLHVQAMRFCGRIRAGISEAYALQQVKATSADLALWKQDPDFMLELDASIRLRSKWKRDDALNIAEENAAPLMAEAVGIGFESRNDADRLKAIAHVHGAIGIGAKGAAGVNVQVNVGMAARAYASTNEEGETK